MLQLPARKSTNRNHPFTAPHDYMRWKNNRVVYFEYICNNLLTWDIGEPLPRKPILIRCCSTRKPKNSFGGWFKHWRKCVLANRHYLKGWYKFWWILFDFMVVFQGTKRHSSIGGPMGQFEHRSMVFLKHSLCSVGKRESKGSALLLPHL